MVPGHRAPSGLVSRGHAPGAGHGRGTMPSPNRDSGPDERPGDSGSRYELLTHESLWDGLALHPQVPNLSLVQFPSEEKWR